MQNSDAYKPKTGNPEIGERMRDIRVSKRLTQQDVASLLHVNRVTYQQWESGRNEMAVTDLPRIAKILGTTTSYLLGEITEDQFVDEEAVRFYNGLPPPLQRVARAQLKALFDTQDEEAKQREPATHGKKAE